MPRALSLRGVIEGFYGAPWSRASRLDVVRALGACGMNAYVYAPKDDPKHRAAWREPYDAGERGHFRELAAAGADAGVRVGFAVSPGLDIDLTSPVDRAALVDKLAGIVLDGIDWIILAVDDIPLRPRLAQDHADAVTLLRGTLAELGPLRLDLVPTEYVGTCGSEYLDALARLLPDDVGVMWTGPTVCSPTITAADAAARAAALGGRPPLLWDNYPVNDATMTGELHLGAYTGRDPALATVLDGVLLNPMTQPRASLVAVRTAAEWCADPASYDPEGAWARAVEAVGGRAAPALRALGLACRQSALAGPEADPLHRALDVLEAAPPQSREAALAAVRSLLDEVHAAADGWPDGAEPALRDEVAPWLAAARREAEAGIAAHRLVRELAGTSPPGAAPAGVDADRAMLLAFTVLFAWAAARDEDRHAAFGRRFALYPAVVQLPDGRPALDVGAALREGDSAIDRLCRFALDRYEAWRVAQ